VGDAGLAAERDRGDVAGLVVVERFLDQAQEALHIRELARAGDAQLLRSRAGRIIVAAPRRRGCASPTPDADAYAGIPSAADCVRPAGRRAARGCETGRTGGPRRSPRPANNRKAARTPQPAPPGRWRASAPSG